MKKKSVKIGKHNNSTKVLSNIFNKLFHPQAAHSKCSAKEECQNSAKVSKFLSSIINKLTNPQKAYSKCP
jgi:hypothetical protein